MPDQLHPIIGEAKEKCARRACNGVGRLPHRDLPGLYCRSCARLINSANGVRLIGGDDAPR